MGKGTDPFREDLEEFDGEFPISWVPNVGDILVGHVVRWDEGTTHFGRYPICVVLDEDEGEERSVWIFHHVLLDEFRKQRPKIGERIGIKRLEDGKTADGQHYRRYVLRVEREAKEAPDLEQYVPTVDAPPRLDEPEPEDPEADGPEPGDDLPF